jgi:hypothetical protein
MATELHLDDVFVPARPIGPLMAERFARSLVQAARRSLLRALDNLPADHLTRDRLRRAVALLESVLCELAPPRGARR